MTVTTSKFIRKPFEIEAIQVTAENIDEVAKWCQGEVVRATEGQGPHYIKVRVHHPLTERQTKAFVGDWVLYAGKGYKVYTNKAFEGSFEPRLPQTPLITKEQAEELKVKIKQKEHVIQDVELPVAPPVVAVPMEPVRKMGVND